ncbi:hypothetical protein NO559_16300 [Dasania sp. GY-MA-18]|uniref:Uncharacterized protein n=1 Tax=Dasania phycosphaerae TaxID=2950436 RepID=A0A9J6RQL4_9GAMM|nr:MULTISPECIES: hypothetical protein [Dasania]MCR8924337.1 hypothetical protein [Dasania sp. GY-MA-18]MCZ0866990.1 hypothetical protein [Dasania phycosphaerae]MCZ0870494.1 hypothetical protein [Dasania phycosphaerae]
MMHEYHKIKNAVVELISPLGYQEDKPDTELDYCGSMHSIYASGEKRFMIQWDGEEGFGSVEIWQGNNTWVLLKPIVPEAKEIDFNKNLTALCLQIKAQL